LGKAQGGNNPATGENAVSTDRCLRVVSDKLTPLLQLANKHGETPTAESTKAIKLLVKYLKYAEQALREGAGEQDPQSTELGEYLEYRWKEGKIINTSREGLGQAPIHRAVVTFCSDNHFSVELGESLLGREVEICSYSFQPGDRVEYINHPIMLGSRYYVIKSRDGIKINPGSQDSINYTICHSDNHYGGTDGPAKQDELRPVKPLSSLTDDELLEVCMNLGNPDAYSEIIKAIGILKKGDKLRSHDVLAALLSSENRFESFDIPRSGSWGRKGTRYEGKMGPFERAEMYGKLFAGLITSGAPLEGQTSGKARDSVSVMDALLTSQYPGFSIENVIYPILARYDNIVQNIPEHPRLLLSVINQQPETAALQMYEMYGDPFYCDFEYSSDTAASIVRLEKLFDRLVESGADVNAGASYGWKKLELKPIELAYDKYRVQARGGLFYERAVLRLIELGAIVPDSLYEAITSWSQRNAGRLSELEKTLLRCYVDQNPGKLDPQLEVRINTQATSVPKNNTRTPFPEDLFTNHHHKKGGFF
jgi:hypothetical protein